MSTSPAEDRWSFPYYSHLGLLSADEPLFRESAPSKEPADQIEYAARLGFSGVEDNTLTLRAVSEQRRIGEALKALGLSLGCFVFGMAVRKQALWNSTGRESEERLSRAFDACLEAAERTRARYVTVVTGEAAGEPRELQMARFAENLARLAADAQAAGLTFCIEAHAASRTPGMLLRHIGEAYEIACKVNSAAVKLVFDVGHVSLMEGGLVENLVRYADQVAVMQLADMPGRVELGAGSIDFVKLLRTARECGISGPYELEHNLSQAGIVGERRALERLRSIDRILRPGAETTK